MKSSFVLAVACVVLMVSSAVAQPGKKNNQSNKQEATKKVELKQGDPAPDWTLTGSDGKVYKLSDFKGKKGVVVAWYPAALTGG